MSDEIKINSELPQKLVTLGQVKNALGKRDKKISSLKEDLYHTINKTDVGKSLCHLMTIV